MLCPRCCDSTNTSIGRHTKSTARTSSSCGSPTSRTAGAPECGPRHRPANLPPLTASKPEQNRNRPSTRPSRAASPRPVSTKPAQTCSRMGGWAGRRGVRGGGEPCTRSRDPSPHSLYQFTISFLYFRIDSIESGLSSHSDGLSRARIDRHEPRVPPAPPYEPHQDDPPPPPGVGNVVRDSSFAPDTMRQIDARVERAHGRETDRSLGRRTDFFAERIASNVSGTLGTVDWVCGTFLTSVPCRMRDM